MPPPRPDPGLAGGRRGCVPVCAGHIPLPKSRCRALLTQLRLRGFPSPSSEIPRAPPAHFAKARKRPSPRQRNSCLPPLSVLLPARDTPRRPPSTPATPRAHTPGGRDQGTESRVGESAFPTPRGYSCPCTPPGDAPRQPRPHHLLPKASRAPDTATHLPKPKSPAPSLQLSDRGARRTQSGWGVRSPGRKRFRLGWGMGSRSLFTRFLLRSLRCLRR